MFDLWKTSKKARDFQNGTVLPENWFDSEKNSSKNKNGDKRETRRKGIQQKRNFVSFLSFFLFHYVIILIFLTR